MSHDRPLALTDGLVTEDVDGKLHVHDAERGRTWRLNQSAALVWKACDGRRTVGDLADAPAQELGGHADEDLVLIALDDLAEHGLIVSGYGKRKPAAARLSRRRLLRRVGLTGATAVDLPIVYGTVPPALANSVEAHGALADF